MYTFTVPREKFDERAPNKQMIRQLISKHISIVGRMQKNMAYYKGQHEILSDADRENKLVCNHAKDISDTASSYFIGNPVTYKAEGDIKALTDALETAEADETDGDNGLELSIYGLAYEYVYVKENENDLVTKNLSAENTFMVKDDSIEERELFAVYYYVRKDDSGTSADHFRATILTSRYRYELDIEDSSAPQITVEEPQEHYMCEIPIIEYLNNKLGIGDFELQIPLIDAYNALMSDRITDKEQFIDSILAIYGTLLADDEVDENGEKKEGDVLISIDTGSGSISAGQIVTFAGDPNRYVVAAATSNLITLAAPGLRQDLADDTAITVVGAFTANMAFDRNAFLLASRTPAMPEGGDNADDVMNVTDPISGIAFQIALYRQYRQVRYEVGLAWGVSSVKPAHGCLILG